MSWRENAGPQALPEAEAQRTLEGVALQRPAFGKAPASCEPALVCAPHAYWITSSAKRSRDGDIVSPSALAVLRLRTSSRPGYLHEQVGWGGPLQNLAHQHGGAMLYCTQARPVGEQGARYRQLPLYPYQRQPVLKRKVSNLSSILAHRWPPARSASIVCLSAVSAGKTHAENSSRLSHIEVAERQA